MTLEQQVWLQAYTAYINGRTISRYSVGDTLETVKSAANVADKAVEDFKKRFPYTQDTYDN